MRNFLFVTMRSKWTDTNWKRRYHAAVSFERKRNSKIDLNSSQQSINEVMYSKFCKNSFTNWRGYNASENPWPPQSSPPQRHVRALRCCNHSVWIIMRQDWSLTEENDCSPHAAAAWRLDLQFLSLPIMTVIRVNHTGTEEMHRADPTGSISPFYKRGQW